MTRYIGNLFIALLVSLSVPVQSWSQTTLKATLDSAYVLMGKTTPLHIELVAPASAGGTLIVPADTLCDKVEILKALTADTTDIKNGRIQIDQELLLQSFDSGTYILNPIRYVAGGETIASNPLVLKVIPVAIDSLTSINDYADVVDVDRKLADYLPDFIVDYGLWIIALLLLLALGYFTFKRLTRKKTDSESPVIQIPPYELAIRELESLRSDKLCEQGREKEYYTRLTDILRQYLQGRFGINAMEMTSTQIRHTINANEETRMSKTNMDRVLETADFVKFAKVRPLPDDNVQAYNSALQFVEDTKPRPVVKEEEDSNNEPQTSSTESETNV